MGDDVFDFDGGFVAVVVEMEVNYLELEVGDVVSIAWCCVNGVTVPFVAFESKVSGREYD